MSGRPSKAAGSNAAVSYGVAFDSGQYVFPLAAALASKEGLVDAGAPEKHSTCCFAALLLCAVDARLTAVSLSMQASNHRPNPCCVHTPTTLKQRLDLLNRNSTDQTSDSVLLSESLVAAAGGFGGAAAGGRSGGGSSNHADLVRRASKALLKQVEETRRKYTLEVEGLKAEVGLLVKERARHDREAEHAAAAAASATKAAANATGELERLNAQLRDARTALSDLHR